MSEYGVYLRARKWRRRTETFVARENGNFFYRERARCSAVFYASDARVARGADREGRALTGGARSRERIWCISPCSQVEAANRDVSRAREWEFLLQRKRALQRCFLRF